MSQAKFSAVNSASRDDPPIKIEGKIPGYNFYCGECGKSAQTPDSLQTHFGEVHAGGFPCPVPGCRKFLANRHGVRLHIATSHPGLSVPKIECPCKYNNCRESFPDTRSLAAHSRSAHGCILQDSERQRPFKCVDCHTNYASLSSIARHRRTTHTPRVHTENLKKEQTELLESARLRHAARQRTKA